MQTNKGDHGYQQHEENSHQSASHSVGKSAERNERADQERSIQTGRENDRTANVARRQQTSPTYGMTGGHFTPFTMMRRMAEDMDRLFENFGLGHASGSSTAWMPQVETFRRGDKLVVRADLPGMRKEDVNVEVDDGMLTISGERCDEHDEDGSDFYRSERSYGQFYRAIPLPDGIDTDQCDASFKDGVLEVTLAAPKTPERKNRQVQVK